MNIKRFAWVAIVLSLGFASPVSASSNLGACCDEQCADNPDNLTCQNDCLGGNNSNCPSG